MTDADIKHLLWLGLASDEIWCAIAEPGPWTLQTDPTDCRGDDHAATARDVRPRRSGDAGSAGPRIRRRYQEPERRPPPCPENVARAHLDTIHRILGEDHPADATP